MHQPSSQGAKLGFVLKRDSAMCPPLGTINVIFATLQGMVTPLMEVMTISPQPIVGEEAREAKRSRIEEDPILGFMEVGKWAPSNCIMTFLWLFFE